MPDQLAPPGPLGPTPKTGPAPVASAPVQGPSFDDMFAQAENSEKDGLNEAALAKYPPDVRLQAKMLTDYKATMSPMAMRDPYWKASIRAANEYDPTFNVGMYANRQKLENNFMSGGPGSAADNIKAINTAIAHAARYKKSAQALNNIDFFTPLNVPLNAINQMHGDTRRNTFDVDAKALSDELTRAFRGANGSEADVKTWQQTLNHNAGRAQQIAAADEAIKLLAGRMGTLRDQYLGGMGRPPRQKFLNEHAKGVLAGMGYDPDKFETGMTGEDGGATPAPPHGVPDLGSTFNGGKVLKVTPIP